jgi:hypothetical protein
MGERRFRSYVTRFTRAARAHSEFKDISVDEVTANGARLTLYINVEMPLRMRFRGRSDTGVQRIESVTVVLDEKYPWSSPHFFLRQGFNRSLPHLFPGPSYTQPRPCLVDGSQQEFFYNSGSLEAAVFNLIEQLVLWLQRAARGTLIDPEHGWEPIRRDSLQCLLEADADELRRLANREAGFAVYPMWYGRVGQATPSVENAYKVLGRVDIKHSVLLSNTNLERLLAPIHQDSDMQIGHSFAAVFWPASADGSGRTIGTYMPETVYSVGELVERASAFNADRHLHSLLHQVESITAPIALRALHIPFALIFCVRRPINVLGTDSPIELIPYIANLNFPAASNENVRFVDTAVVLPAAQIDVLSSPLLQRVSGIEQLSAVSILGCGSVGSKLALHLARSGVPITALADSKRISSHNLARHALTKADVNKAKGICDLIADLGQKPPAVVEENLLSSLRNPRTREMLLPRPTARSINTTASLVVRETLASLSPSEFRVPLMEIGLFGRGRGGFLFVEGKSRNPNLSDCMTEFYSTIESDYLRELVFGEGQGLQDVQIGQGCGSMAMPMTDARLSLIVAGMAEEVMRVLAETAPDGEVVTAVSRADDPSTTWLRRVLRPFKIVAIEGTPGWTFRLSPSVIHRIREEQARYSEVETGGVMMGIVSERCKTITVVDLIDAPPDSVRSAPCFKLGTAGLKDAITTRFYGSGMSLFDVGTWHTHLSNSGPSYRDRRTARELAEERPPPSALLIVCPSRYYGLMKAPDLTDGRS